MDIQVDPREVVQHLHELGFSNITHEQLKEFIKDLKKLIKYDIHSCRCQEYSHRPNSSGAFQSAKTSYREADTSNSNRSNILREYSNNEISKEISSSESYETGSNSSSSRISSSDNTSGSPDLSHANHRKTEKPNDDTQQKKIRSAFIRTWNLQKGAVPSGTAQRSDPVRLYHQYQSVWKKQKIPGENSHADLRWAVREKMLGDHPNPRPVSQASSLNTLHRRRRI